MMDEVDDEEMEEYDDAMPGYVGMDQNGNPVTQEQYDQMEDEEMQ